MQKQSRAIKVTKRKTPVGGLYVVLDKRQSLQPEKSENLLLNLLLATLR